jgi:hypothetical protein
MFGLVPCLGHGVMIDIKILKDIGGFPQLIVSEDIAFTLVARNKGYFGVFSKDIVAKEKFPKNYFYYRKRFFRWIMADFECIIKYVIPFLKSKAAPMFEKVDILIREAKMPAASLIFPLICLNGLNLDTFKFEFFNSMDFKIIALFVSFTPFICFLIKPRKKNDELTKFIFHSVAIYLSFIFLSTLAIIKYFSRKQTKFTIIDTQVKGWPKTKANNSVMLIIEFTLGIILSWVAVQRLDFILLGIAIALMSSIFFNRFEWEKRLIQLLAYLPFSLIICGILTNILGYSYHPESLLFIIGLSTIIFS